MSVEEKAQELADLIMDSSEYTEWKEAEKKMQEDESAQDILQKFQAKQKMAQMAQMNGKGLSQDMQKEIQGIQAKMQQNEKIKAFMEAQQGFNEVMKTVNQVISSTLQGQEA